MIVIYESLKELFIQTENMDWMGKFFRYLLYGNNFNLFKFFEMQEKIMRIKVMYVNLMFIFIKLLEVKYELNEN